MIKKSGILLALVLTFVIVTLVLFAIKRDKPIEEPKKDDFLTIPNYESTSSSTSYDGNSYWFVVVEDRDGTTKRNTFVKQEHSYFSYAEAKAAFGKDCFILNFVKVDKETYEHNNTE